MDELYKVKWQIVASFHRKHSYLEKEEIDSTANLIMLEAIKTFDAEKGRNLKSWVGFMLHRNLKKLFCYEMNLDEYLDEFTGNFSYNPERILMTKESILSMSQAAKEIIGYVFKESIYEKKELKEKLRTNGFAWNKIQTAFCELRKFANALG